MPAPTASEVREVLEAHQALPLAALRTEGLDGCRIEADFVPRIACGAASPERDEALDALSIALERRDAADSNDALHAKALLHLASASEDIELDSVTIQEILADLDEVLAATEDPARRSRALTDLASAHLLLAEANQGTLEVGAALEAALEALEIAPDDPEARFVRSYAELLLGLIHGDDVADDPVLTEIAALVAGSKEGDCTQEAMIADLDAWVADPEPAEWQALMAHEACLGAFEDRFPHDLIASARHEPEKLRQDWRRFRALRQALSPDEEVMNQLLDPLTREGVTEVTRWSAEYFRAWAPYQNQQYPEALAQLESYTAEVEARGYDGLTANAYVFLGLIAESQGDLSQAQRWQERAAQLQEKLGIAAIDAKVRVRGSELDDFGGREYDAWISLTLSLRDLGPSSLPGQRIGALSMFANLAADRRFEQTAFRALDRALALAEPLEDEISISTLRSRIEIRARFGYHHLAREDLELARRLLESPDTGSPLPRRVAANLDVLEGFTHEDPSIRRQKLESALDHLRAVEHSHRIVPIQHQLALVQQELGDLDAAFATLEEALTELSSQVRKAPSWREATAIVAAARPMVETLVGLQLDHRSPEEVRTTIGRYLGLRTQDEAESAVARVETPRLTTFVRNEEILLLFEDSEELLLERRPVAREALRELRRQVLSRTRPRAGEFESTLRTLSEVLLTPFGPRLTQRDGIIGRWDAPTLTIVADDVLAGVPFHLLPIGLEGEGSQRLIERWVVVYATDLRAPAPEPEPGLVLSIGASGAGSGLTELPKAEDEARTVAGVHLGGRDLVGPEATPDKVLEHLTPGPASESYSTSFDTLHLALHFETDTRRPLQSTLVLATPAGASEPARLTLEELLETADDRLSMLYFSACDTGRGLPTEAHGLHSLAQAFPASGIARTVLTLWPLGDSTGAALAKRFHQLVAQGIPAARALRTAQLEQSDRHPSEWGALVVVQ